MTGNYKIKFFRISGKKETSHSHSGRVSRPGWAKLSGESSLDLMPFGGHWARGFPPVFWQSGRDLSLFSTGTEKRDLSGVSGINRSTWGGNGARIGVICPQGTYLPYYQSLQRGGNDRCPPINLFTCSLFPNASIAAPVSGFLPVKPVSAGTEPQLR